MTCGGGVTSLQLTLSFCLGALQFAWFSIVFYPAQVGENFKHPVCWHKTLFWKLQAHSYPEFSFSPAVAPVLLLPHQGWLDLVPLVKRFNLPCTRWSLKSDSYDRLVCLGVNVAVHTIILQKSKEDPNSDFCLWSPFSSQVCFWPLFLGVHLHACLPPPLPGWVVLVCGLGNLPPQHCK